MAEVRAARGTLACWQALEPDRAYCQCGWTEPAKSRREAKRRWQTHVRLVRQSLGTLEPRTPRA